VSERSDNRGILQNLKKHWFAIAVILAIVFGYAAGKDRAERDNTRDSINGANHDQ
jgi:prolipoprotein diacylglyceryltransferase